VSGLPGDLPFDLGGESNAASYARMLGALLPPGKIWRLIPGAGTLYALLEGCAIELASVAARVADLLTESNPTTTSELLPEFERELNLSAASSVEERRARIVSLLIRRQSFRPVDFQAALAPLLGQDPEDVVVIERSRAFAISVSDDREIFRFFIYRDPTLPGTYFLSSAQEAVDAMKPSHTLGYVIESIAFRCGDPFSLCGRDLLGAG
jgi:uncharacterized protein YmfQ (DUF2313 family)